MADHNANKITVWVQVEPTPGTPETNSQQPTASTEARSEARRAQPERDTPDAIASGPPTAADTNEGLQAAAPAGLESIELDDSILDLVPGEVDDFTEVNMNFAAALLEDDVEEIAQHIAETYNPGAEKAHPGQDYPELEIGVDGLNLGDSDSDPEEPRGRKAPLLHPPLPLEPQPGSQPLYLKRWKWKRRGNRSTTIPGYRSRRRGSRSETSVSSVVRLASQCGCGLILGSGMLLFRPSRGNPKCTPGRITTIPLVCTPAAPVRKDSRRGK